MTRATMRRSIGVTHFAEYGKAQGWKPYTVHDLADEMIEVVWAASDEDMEDWMDVHHPKCYYVEGNCK